MQGSETTRLLLRKTSALQNKLKSLQKEADVAKERLRYVEEQSKKDKDKLNKAVRSLRFSLKLDWNFMIDHNWQGREENCNSENSKASETEQATDKQD